MAAARMKMNPWITYRTRFLVKGKQLTTNLIFTDVFGRQHSGRKGDYLVESNEGVLSITPRQIFEDIYVPLAGEQEEIPQELAAPPLYAALGQFGDEPDRDGPDGDEFCQSDPRPQVPARPQKGALFSPPQPLARKSPQPYRDRRNSSRGVRSL